MVTTLQIIGHKKSGKTLITEALTKKLTEANLNICVLKHAHKAQMDIPGTDSDRFSVAGAKQVILTTPTGFFYHKKGQDPSLVDLINNLPEKPDIVLAEGFKTAPYPKLLLLKKDERLADFTKVKNIIQTASINCDVDLNLNSPTKVVNWAFNYLIKKEKA